ncbi:glycosyltransferase family 2 protein [Shewanella canadensis]|uniref:Glycosyltransferase family 2 protein n=1 Tax=Shewanella canadensis TaxID=271096 RepID=A0A431WVT5_9GAMM|nr:glycosyltransferase family A protein [Shewanella canadensis]RTR39555.1 glycosyltransferase family 2 protein [Shewanella canadensis]
MKPISIIIITLNEEKRIGSLLESLSLQTYQNFEVIVIDSNSQDSTVQLALSYSEILPSLTVERIATKGVGLGRNTGAKLATHEQLLFLDVAD